MKKCLVFPFVVLASCSNGPVARTSDIKADSLQATSEVDYRYQTSTKKQSRFDHRYFESPSSVYSKDLAVFALDASIAACKKDSLTKFYEDMGFENVFYSEAYTTGHAELDCQYSFAARKMNGFYLIDINLNGFQYEVEFVDNVNIGAEGDHYGFTIVKDKVLNSLSTYMKAYDAYKVKFLAQGYSRTAAIAQLLGASLSEENPYEANEDDIYVYTFEAPAAFSDPKDHKNIHGVVNDDDMVNISVPEAFGLKHGGVKHNIYNGLIEEFVDKEFPELGFEAFKGDDAHPNLKTLMEEVLPWLTEDYSGEGSTASVLSRQDYVGKYQASFMYFVRLFTKRQQLPEGAEFDDLGIDFLSLLSENGFKRAAIKLVDAFGITYDEEELERHAKAVFPLFSAIIKKHKLDILGLKDLLMENVGYISAIHLPAVTYALLVNS